MLGSIKLGWKKSSAIVVTLAIAGVAVPHTTAAKEWIVAQQKRQSAIEPATPPNAFNAPSQLGTPTTPNSFNSPSQPGTTPPGLSSTSPDSRTPSTRSRSTKRERRIPIPDVPMPGDNRPNLDSVPEKTRRLSDIPSSTTQYVSGISGKVTLVPICSFSTPATECQPRPYQGSLKVRTTSDGRVTRFNANANGEYQLRLAPGLYAIESDDPTSPLGAGQTVTVVNGVLRQLDLQIQAQLPQSNSSQLNSQSNSQSRQSSSQSNSQPTQSSQSN